MIKPNLIVIRSNNIDDLANFYSSLGCTFEKHSHGKGPEHYAYEIDGFVFEIYPQNADKPPTTGIRLGFTVNDIDKLINIIKDSDLGKIISKPKDSPWGRRAVINDPEGHRVELIQV